MLNSIGFSEAFEYMLMNFLKEPFKKPFPSYTTMIESYSPGIKGCGPHRCQASSSCGLDADKEI